MWDTFLSGRVKRLKRLEEIQCNCQVALEIGVHCCALLQPHAASGMQEQDLTKDSKMKHERGNGIKGTDEAVIMMMGEKRSEGIS